MPLTEAAKLVFVTASVLGDDGEIIAGPVPCQGTMTLCDGQIDVGKDTRFPPSLKSAAHATVRLETATPGLAIPMWAGSVAVGGGVVVRATDKRGVVVISTAD